MGKVLFFMIIISVNFMFVVFSFFFNFHFFSEDVL